MNLPHEPPSLMIPSLMNLMKHTVCSTETQKRVLPIQLNTHFDKPPGRVVTDIQLASNKSGRTIRTSRTLYIFNE